MRTCFTVDGQREPNMARARLAEKVWRNHAIRDIAKPMSHEILEELVSGVRGLDERFREIEGTLSEQGPRSRRRLRHFPMMLEEIDPRARLSEGN